MNKFWGRNDNNMKPRKFARDDDQLLSLNYENLCDSDYLNRLFNEDANSGNLFPDKAKPSAESWELTPDMAEDVVIFGDDDTLYKDFLRRRATADIISFHKYQDSLAFLIYKQVDVFEHMSKIAMDKVLTSNSEVNLCVHTSNSGHSVGGMSSLVSDSLCCTLQVVEKNSRKGLRASTVESILQLLTNCMLARSQSRLSMKTFLSSSSVDLLRALFSNGILQSARDDGSCSEVRENSLRVALCASYGELMLGIQNESYFDILIAVTQLLLLSIQLDDLKSIFDCESSNSASVSTSDPNGREDTNKKNRLAKMKVVDSTSKTTLPSSINNKFQGPTILSLGDDNARSELSYEDAIYQTDVPNNPNAVSWDRKSVTTITLPAKMSVMDKDRDSKGKFSLLKPKTPLAVTAPSKQLHAGNSAMLVFEDATKSKLPQTTIPGYRERELSGPLISGKAVPMKMQLSTASNSENISVDIYSAVKGLFMVPKSLVCGMFEVLSDSQICPSSSRNTTGTKRLSGIVKGVSSAATVQSKQANQFSRKSAATYVWSCGQNSYGELGLGDVNQRKSFARVSHFDNKGVVSIGAGNEHSLFVTKDGKLFVAGYNDNGQCGTGSTQQVRQLTALQSLDAEEIASVHVHNGCEHTLVITKDGKLYSFGYNYRGQLGHGTICSESTPRPIKSLMSKKVLFAASSYHHSLVYCSDGTLFAFGRNDSGQLGLGDFTDRKSPQIVSTAPRDIANMSCGQFHSVVVSSAGEALICGKNDYGQLGFESPENVKSFTRVKLPPQVAPQKGNHSAGMSDSVKQVCCGYYHTLLLLHNGNVVGVGRNDYGQLGLGHPQPKLSSCQLIHGLSDKSVIAIAAGCYHSVAATSNGMLYMFGRNNHGQLGSGDVDEHHLPHPVDNFVGTKIVGIAAGFYHTLVLTSESLFDHAPEKNPMVRPAGNTGHTMSDLWLNATSSMPLLDLLDKAQSMGASPTAAAAATAAAVTGRISRVGSENNKAPFPSTSMIGVEDKLMKGSSRISFRSNGSGDVDLTMLNSDSDAPNGQHTDTEGNNTNGLQSSSGSKVAASESFHSKQMNSVFALNSRSKLPLPELWRSMVVHMNDMLESSLSEHENAFDWRVKSPKELKLEFSWIIKLLQCCNALMEMSLHEILASTQSSSNGIGEASNRLPAFPVISSFLKNSPQLVSAQSNQQLRVLSIFTSLQLLKTAVRTVDSLLLRYGDFLSCLSQLHDSSTEGCVQTYSQFLRSLHQINAAELTSDIHEKSSSMFQSIYHSSDLNSVETSVPLCDIFASDNQDLINLTLSRIRNKVLFLSLHLVPALELKDSLNNKFKDNYEDLVLCSSTVLCCHIDRLYPSFSDRSQLITLLSSSFVSGFEESLNSSSLNQVFPMQQDRCLKLFTKICFKFRDINVVFDLFKQSKFIGLQVFKDILNAYTNLLLVNTGINHLSEQASIAFGAGDVFRSLSTLEYCCSNFVKCALPLIFELHDASSNSSLTNLTKSVDARNSDVEISALGLHIIREVCRTSEFVLDSVARNHPVDPSSSLGSIISSILPSILLYAIHYSASRSLAPDLLPIVQSLSKSIYKYVYSTQQSIQQANSTAHFGDGSSINSRFDQSSLLRKPKMDVKVPNNKGSDISIGDTASSVSSLNNSLFVESSMRMVGEEGFWKKEPLQLSWCSRLLKICTILSARLVGSWITNTSDLSNKFGRQSLISEGKISQESKMKCFEFERHSLWLFLSGPSMSSEWQSLVEFENAPCHEELLSFPGKQSASSIPTRIISTITALRMRQFKSDPMYKQLFNPSRAAAAPSSSQNSNIRQAASSSIPNSLQGYYQCIEAIIMDCVMHVVGYDTLDLWMNYMDTKRGVGDAGAQGGELEDGARGISQLKLVWNAIVNFSKTIVRNRSKLMSNATEGRHWPDIVKSIATSCTCIRSMILLCIPAVECIHPLLPTCAATTPYSAGKRALRRAVLLVICVRRWQASTKVKASSVGLVVVSFFSSVVECITDAFTCSSHENIQARWGYIVSALNHSIENADRLSCGLNQFIALLQDVPIPSMKCDILSELSKSWSRRVESRKSQAVDAASPLERTGALFCDLSTMLDIKLAISQLLSSVVSISREFYLSYKSNLAAATTGEIVLLTFSLKFLKLYCVLGSGESDLANLLPVSTFALLRVFFENGWSNYFNELKFLFILLNEKSDSVGQVLLQDESQASSKSSVATATKRGHPKDRNKLLRRASSSIIYLLQELSVETKTAEKTLYWSSISNLLLSIHCELLNVIQKSRLSNSKQVVDFDANMNSTKLESSPQHGANLTGSPNKQAINNKDLASKKRCQDLITRAMEFSRSQEGFIVQSDKLLTSYKGSTDFTLALWVYIRKVPTKQSFVSGKVSHHDAWPIVTLKTDGKLALYFGHGNEFDSLFSQVPVQCHMWTHIAIVIEAKKIKLFVNGSPDNHANTKGNIRAITYPVIVGSCPQGIRTRVDHLKEGFEGLISQYKYYTRALSPIHIRVVFDQGPPEAYDVHERWLYQLMGSSKLLLKGFVERGIDRSLLGSYCIPQLAEIFFVLFVSDSTSRCRLAALKLLTSLLALHHFHDLPLFSQSGFTLASSSAAISGGFVTSVMTAPMLDGFESFKERMTLYLVRLIGFCSSPHILSITDELMVESNDFISVVQQQYKNSRLQLQHSVEIDQEFATLREFSEFIPSFLTYRNVKNDEVPSSSVTASGSSDPSREEQLNELQYHVVSALYELSKLPEWQTSISRVLVSIFSKAADTLASSNLSMETTCDGSSSSLHDRLNDSPVSKSFASRVFGRNGAWSLLVSMESIGASLILGDHWSVPCLGSDVLSYFSSSVSRVLSNNRGSGKIVLLSWNNASSSRQLSVVRQSEVTCCKLSISFLLDSAIADASLVRIMGALEQFAALVLTDHLCICKPDHGFQRQSLLRIVRPVEVFMFTNLLQYISRNESAAKYLQDNSQLNSFFTRAVTQAYHVDALEEEFFEEFTDPNIKLLWAKSAKFNVALMGKVCVNEFPPPESERSLIDFVSRGLGVAVEAFAHSPQEHYIKQGSFAHLLVTGDQLNSTIGFALPSKYPMNDWLSAAAEGNAVNLFGSGQGESANSSPAVSTLRCIHLLRQDIIRSSRKVLLGSCFDERMFMSLPFETKYLLWTALCSSAFHLEQLRHHQPHTSVNSKPTSSAQDQSTLQMMTSVLYHQHRSEVTNALTLGLIFAKNSLVPSNTIKYAGIGNILVCSNIISRLFDACSLWMHFHIGRDYEFEFCNGMLKVLLPALSLSSVDSLSLSAISVEASSVSNELELCMVQWCRNSLYRIIQLLTSNRLVKPDANALRDIFSLVNGSNFNLIRTRAQDLLARQRGISNNLSQELAQQLSHLAANLEIIQRICCHPLSSTGFISFQAACRVAASAMIQSSPRPSSRASALSRPVSAAALRFVANSALTPATALMSATCPTPSNSIAIAGPKQTASHFDDLPVAMTDSPKIIGSRETVVDIDLTACVTCAIAYVDYFNYRTTRNNSEGAAMSFEEFRMMASLQSDDISNIICSENTTIDVMLGVDVPGEETVFHTIYCGNSLLLTHSGLSPNCSYTVKCRAYVAVNQVSFSLDWSKEVCFKTDDGVCFTFDPVKCGPDIMLSDDGLTASYAGDDSWSSLIGTRSFTTGVTCWKIKVTQSSTAYIFVGIASSQADLNTFLGGCSHGYGFIGEQALYHNREKVKVYGEPFGSGDIVGVILDLNAGTVSFTKNGKNLGVAFDKIYGEIFPAVAFYNIGQELEIMPNMFHTTCPHEPIPCSLSRANVDDIGILWEILYSLNSNAPLPHRVLAIIADHCNDWCNTSLVRYKVSSGKWIFLSKVVPASLQLLGLTVGERVRSPYGVAEILGFAYNRVWFCVEDNTESIWFVSYSQILKGKEKGYFLTCTYTDSDLLSDPCGSGCNVVVDSGSVLYDAATLAEVLEPTRWSQDMDNALLAFLMTKGDESSTSPWQVPASIVNDEYRTLQQSLSRIVMSSVDLSHRYGIAGPKRKAVIARLGLLRYFNHMVDHYMPTLLAASMSSNIEFYYSQLNSSSANRASIPDDHVKLVTITSLECAAEDLNVLPPPPLPIDVVVLPPKAPCTCISCSADSKTANTKDEDSEQPNLQHPLLGLSWLVKPQLLPANLSASRMRIFTDIKLAHFWDLLAKTVTRTSKIDDDYDYPDDLPQIRINRYKSFRAREASELMGISGEDLLLSSMFYQLMKELRKEGPEKLRMSYTHPMDDGQSRAFKIKFDGEGVDDYGGPYREIFQQICDELQRPDPVHASAFEAHTAVVASSAGTDPEIPRLSNTVLGSAIGVPVEDIRPIRCFIQVLMPTPNWIVPDCAERYKYTFYPGSISSVRTELYTFLGQLVGIALRSKITLDIMLASYVWKFVVQEPLTEKDIASFDQTAYQFISQLGNLHTRYVVNDLSDEARAAIAEEIKAYIQDQTWVSTRSDGRKVELCAGGASRAVLIEDLGHFIAAFVEAKLLECYPAITAFRNGLLTVIPESAIALLTCTELEQLVCGSMTIDIDRLRENTEYDDDISPSDPHIDMFWEILKEFSELEKSAFLRFVWARPTLPPKGVDFPQKFKIQSAVGEDSSLKPDQYLPKAHTCFFSINLPKYSSKMLMAEKLRYAIANCTEMDADFKLTDADVPGWDINIPRDA